jgi:hypothetical protein
LIFFFECRFSGGVSELNNGANSDLATVVTLMILQHIVPVKRQLNFRFVLFMSIAIYNTSAVSGLDLPW